MGPRGLFSCFGRGGATTTTSKAEEEDASGGGPVVVELFTSQGCASSPEAELLFSRLGRGDFNLDVPLVLLAYHVDYWDYNGWKDPYGSSQWTVRQKVYVETLNLDTMFTPQVVVQGQAQCMANETEDLLQCIAAAQRFPAPSFQVTFQRPTPDSLQVSLSGPSRLKLDDPQSDVNIMIALYECGLVTNCPAGANKDKVLANDYVVRRLEKLCSASELPVKKNTSVTVNLALWEGFNPSKCGVAVFVEDSSSHQIFGSQKFQLPQNL